MTKEDIMEILPGIYRIPVPLTGNPLKELNSYVIRGNGNGDRNVLVDTGFRREECRNAVLEGLKLLGIRMEDTDILLTHLHHMLISVRSTRSIWWDMRTNRKMSGFTG